MDFIKLLKYNEDKNMFFKNVINKLERNKDLVFTEFFNDNYFIDLLKNENTYSEKDFFDFIYLQIKDLDVFKDLELKIIYSKIDKPNIFIYYKNIRFVSLNLYNMSVNFNYLYQIDRLLDKSFEKSIRKTELEIKKIEQILYNINKKSIWNSKQSLFIKLYDIVNIKKDKKKNEEIINFHKQVLEIQEKQLSDNNKKIKELYPILKDIEEIYAPRLIKYFKNLEYNVNMIRFLT